MAGPSNSALRVWRILSWLCVLTLLLLGIWWVFHLPPVGKGGVFLAVGATLMPLFWEKIGAIARMSWIAMLFLFLAIEYRAIDKDRADFARDEAGRGQEENQKFADIGTAITNNVQKLLDHSDSEFAKTMARSDAIISGVGDSIRTQTGGDSFAFITFTAQPAQAFEMHWNNFLAPRGEPYFLVSVTSHGKYPLRGTRTIMMDDERRLAAMQEYNKHPNGDWIKAIDSADTEYQIPYLRPQSAEAPQGEVNVIGIYPTTQRDSKKLTMNFSAANGYWNEVLHLGRVNGVWHQCLSVLGPTVKQAKHPFIYCDSDWQEGKKLAEKDWVFTPPTKQ
jgi:hypothetical protein